MKIEFNPSAVASATWREYAIRFLLGGLVTAGAGLIARKFGPVIGGLFMAFPAIFPAAATLIEEQDERAGSSTKSGEHRAQVDVGADAAGAAAGSIGLLAFAAIVWRILPTYSPGFTLVVATLGWFGLSFLGWILIDRFWR